MLSPSAEIGRPLVAALEDTLQALAHLHATAARMRPTDGSASGFPAFSVAELDRLRHVIRQGEASVTRRLKELAGDDNPSVLRFAELWRQGAARPDATIAGGTSAAEIRSRSLLAAYRAACRSICTSLQQARNGFDRATAVMLSTLLQRLEKQLWLLDSSPERVRVGLPTINLFLSC